MEDSINEGGYRRRLKKSSLYGKIINDLHYSSKTMKCREKMVFHLHFTEGKQPDTYIIVSVTDNQDGTATMTIEGSKDIKVEDKRGMV